MRKKVLYNKGSITIVKKNCENDEDFISVVNNIREQLIAKGALFNETVNFEFHIFSLKIKEDSNVRA